MRPNVLFATVGLVPANTNNWNANVFGGFGQVAVRAADPKEAIIALNRHFQNLGFAIYSIEDMRTKDEYKEIVDDIRNEPESEENKFIIDGYERLNALADTLSEINPVVIDTESISLMENYEEMAAFGKIDLNMLGEVDFWGDGQDDDDWEEGDEDDDDKGDDDNRSGDSGGGLRLRLN